MLEMPPVFKLLLFFFFFLRKPMLSLRTSMIFFGFWKSQVFVFQINFFHRIPWNGFKTEFRKIGEKRGERKKRGREKRVKRPQIVGVSWLKAQIHLNLEQLTRVLMMMMMMAGTGTRLFFFPNSNPNGFFISFLKPKADKCKPESMCKRKYLFGVFSEFLFLFLRGFRKRFCNKNKNKKKLHIEFA